MKNKQKTIYLIAPSFNMKTAIRHWVLTGEWNISATLTFEDKTQEQEARRRLKRFWNRVDKRLYGNQMVRRNRKVERLNILEGDGIAENFHFHAAIKMPTDRFNNPYEFSKFLAKLWREENGKSGFKTDISPINDELAWAIYITKRIPRLDSDVLDENSSHFVAATC